MIGNEQLIGSLENQGTLKSVIIKKALFAIDRKYFIPRKLEAYAYADSALPLAQGQTISQPTTVVIMLEFLDAQKGHKVLDIGAGSGWVSCLLGYIIGKDGKVFAYEINKIVGKMGLENIRKVGALNVFYEIADASKKWKENAPYDLIHVAAAFEKIPKKLKNTLKIGGILVAPTQDGFIRKITRINEKNFEEEKHFGFTFVPFVSHNT